MVWARSRETKVDCALKIVAKAAGQGATRKLKREAKILTKIGPHENVIGVQDLHELKKFTVLSLEYASGGTLWDFIHGRHKIQHLTMTEHVLMKGCRDHDDLNKADE